ncbi:hypothetical protein [Schnuerera ultunensis]|uniref:hypothetical protein n=1 Tax=Schnuerera ultunensis TaxID=45497 RepID=UPI0004711261|nr:hypothetical protein [Schnuerera ultunensis]
MLHFSIFVAAAITCMLFINGDIILNYSVTQFAGISIGWAEWAKYMTVPSLMTTILTGVAFILVFRKKLKNSDTEPFHSINSAIIALLGAIAMFGFKIIG